LGFSGSTCADALRALGAPPHVMPENPKMGPLVEAIAEAIEGSGRDAPA
jgi:hypothetical protein